MAKRTTLKRDSFDIDNDLNFDEFDFGDNDALINKEVSSKKRTPVMDVFKGTITGVKDSVKNPNFLAQTVKESLPDQYGTVFETADDVLGTASSLYDEAIREIKPQLSRIAKKIDKLVPEERKFLKKVTSKFKDLAGDETGDFKGQNKEQLQEQSISNSLASVFQTQAEKDQELQARSEAATAIKDTIESKRFNSNFGLLSSINEQVVKFGNYNEKINQAFQKKSLELQFRSYFTQAELLDTTKKFFDVFQKQNEAITKNTALPEFVKIKNSERFKEFGYNKFLAGTHNALFGNKGLLTKGLKTLKEKASGQIQGFKQGLEAGMMGLDQIESMKELNESMGGNAINPSEMAGNMAGAGIAGYARKKVSAFGKNIIEKNDNPLTRWINNTGYKLATTVMNPGAAIGNLRNNKNIQDNIWEGGVKGFAARVADDFLSAFQPGGPDTSLKNANNANSLQEPGIFNNKTKVSIEEIIPGYLSMIHRELIVTRTGNKATPQILYDFSTGKFKTEKSIKESIKANLTKTAEQSGQSYRLNDMFNKMFKDEKIDVKSEGNIKEFLMNLVPENKLAFDQEDSIENIKKTKAFQGLDEKTGELILKRLNELIGSDNKNKDKNIFDITNSFKDLQYRSPNLSGNVQQYLNQGYGNQLEEMNLVSRSDSGDYKLNIDEHQNIVKDTVINSSNNGNRDTYVISALIKNAEKNGVDKTKTDATISKLISEGFGKDLVKLGVIDKDIPKGFKINFPILEKVLKDNGYASSDINVKRNINLLKPKDALTALKKTKIYDWFYKQGKGDQKKKIGPMAQDVNQNIGQQASSNGKNIDLVTMNGVNMAAVKAVDERQTEQQKQIEQLSSGSIKKTEKNPVIFEEKQDPIIAIKTNTDKIIELMQEGNKFVMQLGDLSGLKELAKNVIETAKDKTSQAKEYVSSKGDGYKESIGNLARSATELVIKGSGDLLSAIGKTFTIAKNTASTVGGGLTTVISDLYKTNKDKAMNAIGGLFGAGANLATKVINSATDILFNKLPAGIKQLAQLADWGKNKVLDYFDQPLDIYVKGLETPALRANLMKMGYYLDQSSGKAIMNIRDLMRIKGNIVNKEGNVILTMEDMKDGLFDKAGKPVSTFLSKLGKTAISAGVAGILRGKDAILKSMKVGKAALEGAGEFVKNRFNFKDRVKKIMADMPQFSLPSLDMLGGKSTEILVEIRDILLQRLAVNPALDSKGKLKPSQRIQARQDKSLRNDDEGLQTIEETTSFSDESNNQSTNNQPQPKYVGGGGNNIISKGMQVFGNLKGGLANAKSAKGIKGKALAVLGGLFGGSKDSEQPKEEAPNQEQPKQEEPKKGILSNLKDKIVKKVMKTGGSIKSAFNDKDNSGKRDGAWEDKLKKQEELQKSRNNGVNQASLDPKYKGENVLDTIMKKAGGLIGMLSGGMGGIMEKAGSVFSTITDFIGIGGKGSLIKRVGSILAKVVTSPIKALLGGGKLLGTVGRVGFTAARIAATVAMPALTSLGSIALSAGGALLGAIGGIISSPVVLGAAAIAAVGAGVYFGYKYATRDNADKFQDIRLKQYGLTNSESDKKYNHHILQLEDYLSGEAISFKNKQPFILQDKVDPEKLLSIFDIDKNDKDGADAFNAWFNGRFKPFFLTSIAALRSFDNKTKLPEIDKLKVDQQLQYLKLISFESGPYDFNTSPFKDLPKLNTDKDLAISAINKLIEELNIKNKQDTTAKKDQKSIPAINKATEGNKNQPNTSVDTKPKDASNQLNTEPPKPIRNSVPLIDMNAGEEGKEPPSVSTELGSVKTTPGKVPLADGPIKDGITAGQYIKLQPGVKLEGLNPELLNNFKGMAQEYGELTGKSIIVTSGARSRQEQEALFKKDPKKAAPPGRSLHEFGLALDVNSADLNEMEKHGLMKKYGFTRPIGGEPWHAEPAGIQVNPQKAREDNGFADQAIAASLFKGGGGAGTIPNMPKGRRDAALAVSLLSLPGDKVVSDKDKVKDTLLAKSPEAIKPQTDINKQSNKPTLVVDNTKKSNDKTNTVNSSNIGNSINQSNKYSMNDKMVSPDSTKPSTNITNATDVNGNKPFDTSGKSGDIKQVIANASKKAGTDPAMMTTYAAIESSLNPNAKASTSSASGLFQFTNATWNEQLGKHGSKYGLSRDTSPTDPMASSLLASEYVKSNTKFLEKVKPNPNIYDIYLAHFLGAGGARKFLSANPEEYGSRILPDAANSNKSIFFDGGMPLTIAQIYSKIEAKVKKAAQSYGINLPSSSGGLTANKPKDNKDQIASSTTNTDSKSKNTTVPETAKISPSTPSDITKGSLDTASVNNESTNAQNQTSIKPVKQVEFFKPQQQTVMSSSPSNASQQSKITDNFNSGINTVNDTMAKSLGVQEQMLDVLKSILSNVNPENINAFKESLNQKKDKGGYLDRGPTLRQIPDPAVDLRRRQV